MGIFKIIFSGYLAGSLCILLEKPNIKQNQKIIITVFNDEQSRIGFMKGQIDVPDNFDDVESNLIASLFEGI